MFLRHISSMRPFYEGDGGGGGGPSGDPKPDDAKPRASDILERHGSDAIKLAERLATREGDNYTLREERRQLKEQLAALQGKVPADGAVVLAGDDAKAWEAYRALGKLEDLTAGLSERDTLKAQAIATAREKQITAVAEIVKFKPSVLAQLPGAQDLEFTIAEVEQAGKKVKTVTVKDGDKQTPLADYAKAKWPDFLPALQLAPERPAIGSPLNRQGQTPPAADPAQPRKPLARL